MKKTYSWKNIFKNSIGLVVLLFVSISCFRDSKYENPDNTPRRTPTENKMPSSDAKSPTPSPSASASVSPTANGNSSESLKSQSYQDNLPAGFQLPSDSVGKRILTEYGSVYVAKAGVVVPPKVMFDNADECGKWQSTVKSSNAQISNINVVLQEAALKDLQAAISEAQSAGVKITPNGPESARRSFDDTIRLWSSRVDPGLAYWVKQGKITKEEASRIGALSPISQVPDILKLESQSIYFSKDLKKSILYSVAAPGASQHLWMLALDVAEHANPKVQEIMAKHNWYQTVATDMPHFTYLGVAESELPKLGLKKVSNEGRSFWVPAI